MDGPTIDQAGRAELPPVARAELARALALVESGGGLLARTAGRLSRLAAIAAGPIAGTLGRAFGIPHLPGAETLAPVIAQAMERAFDVARIALPRRAAGERARGAATGSRVAAIASGVVGGAAGLPGFVPDAAFTTMLILRNIAAIAAAEGEDLDTEAARHACIEVFTLGGPAAASIRAAAGGGGATAAGGRGGGASAGVGSGDAQGGSASSEHEGYWTARLVMQGTPLVALIGQAAARFGVVLSEKLAAQVVPLIGAAGGALVNAAFFEHYRALAQGHFVIRRLERDYGIDAVRAAAERQGR